MDAEEVIDAHYSFWGQVTYCFVPKHSGVVHDVNVRCEREVLHDRAQMYSCCTRIFAPFSIEPQGQIPAYLDTVSTHGRRAHTLAGSRS
jgi:hypothetical protein